VSLIAPLFTRASKLDGQFTESQADAIRCLLAERFRVDLAEAKRIRHELRASRFYISDWEHE
jgi:hypothetical protein